jgi:hypothetical protein
MRLQMRLQVGTGFAREAALGPRSTVEVGRAGGPEARVAHARPSGGRPPSGARFGLHRPQPARWGSASEAAAGPDRLRLRFARRAPVVRALS